MWIHIRIEKIIVVEFDFTTITNKKEKNKQHTKRKKIKTKPILRLT